MIYDRPLDRLRDWIVGGADRRGREFWALRGLNLDLPAGTSLGVVGVNGAGKSTLLKILTGTTVPTEGSFKIEGRVSALLELGMGFHPQFTGRENIFFNGKMLGLSDAELAEKTPAIIEFAELTDFIDQPLRTYSSGMGLRLAFAVAASVEPDVLIVDEALSVGDLHFQQKCLARIREFQSRGVTILFVSHDPALIKTFCNEAILLDRGLLVDQGKPDHILDYYNALLAEKYRNEGSGATIIRPDTNGESEKMGTGSRFASASPHFLEAGTGHRVGNFKGIVASVEMISPGTGGNSRLLSPGMKGTIRVRAEARERIPAPTIGILIKDRLGNEVFGVNTNIRGIALPAIEAGGALTVDFTGPMNLGTGLYSITAALHSGPSHTETCYDWIERAEAFQILPSAAEPFIGVCRLELEIETRRMD